MGPCQAPLALITDGQQRAGPDAIQRGLAVAQAQEAHHLRGSDALPQQLLSHHKVRPQDPVASRLNQHYLSSDAEKMPCVLAEDAFHGVV